MPARKSPNLALLIDGDTASGRIIPGLLAEIANYGTASVRRIYGDWTKPYLKSWKTILLERSILPIQQFAYTAGLNATDGAMIIDAMDLLYTGRFDGFCLVSSESDFTRLAARIREQGVPVYGFGERKTPTAFVAACTKFVYYDVLRDPGEGEYHRGDVAGSDDDSDASGHLPPISNTVPTRKLSSSQRVRASSTGQAGFEKKPLDAIAKNELSNAVTNSVREDDWADLVQVGEYLRRISPNLNPRNYGYTRLKEFVEASGFVEVKYEKVEGATGPTALVRLKRMSNDS